MYFNLERYRVQCDKFEGLWMIVQELVSRLKNHFAELRDGVALRLSFMGPLPLQYYFELIDNHFEVNLQWKRLILKTYQAVCISYSEDACIYVLYAFQKLINNS